MKEKLLRALKWSAYPAFYLFCLVLFGYLTFPFDRMKDRILSELGKASKGKNGPVVTVEKLDSYWLSGVQADGVKVRLPADERGSSSRSSVGAFPGMPPGFGSSGDSEPAKDTEIELKEVHARARLLPLIVGRVQVDFWASVFGGEVSGTAPVNNSKGDVDLKIEDAKLSEVEPLQSLLGIPIDGKVNGALSLSPVDGKFSKATGKVELSIKGVVVSDGKTKIQGLLALPPAKVDEIAVAGDAEKGTLKITKLSANGPDLELEGDGKVTLREPWTDSSLDIYVKFRFTDAYRGKDATTKSILGDPGSSMSGLIDQAPKLKKAKRPDGFYGFHIKGKLRSLSFEPSPTDISGSSGSGSSSGTRKSVKGTDSSPTPPSAGKKIGGVALPLGMSSALGGRDKPKDGDSDADDRRKADEKREEKKEDKPEEKAEEKPPERQIANPMQLRPAPPPPEPEPPVINAPPPAPPPGDTPPGGDSNPPPDKPAEEPR